KIDEETKKRINNLAAVTGIKIEEGNIVKQIQNKNSEIDKSISKLEKERDKQGANKEEINKQIKELQQKKALNDGVLEQILKELGVWDQVKDTIESGTSKEKDKGKAVDETKRKLDAQGKQIDSNNRKTDLGIKKEEQRSKEAGRNVSKTVTATDKGTVASIDKRASAPKTKTINIKEKGLATLNKLASSPVTKTVNLFASWSNLGSAMSTLSNRLTSTLRNVKFWEKGTPPSGHPGGPAIVGEKGSELITLPDGRSFLSPGTHTLLNLPKGTHVIPHRESMRIIRNAPRYADGTRNWDDALGNSEFARLLSVNSRVSDTNVVSSGKGNGNATSEMIRLLAEQNKLLMQLLRKNTQIVLNERVVGQELEPIITEIQQRNTRIRTSFT